MKLFISLILFFLAFSKIFLSAEPSSFLTDFSFLDELSAAESFAKNSPKESLQKISLLIKDFKICSEKLMDDEENKELVCELIYLAHTLCNEIQTKQLSPYFSEEFLSELQFLSGIAQKSQTLTTP